MFNGTDILYIIIITSEASLLRTSTVTFSILLIHPQVISDIIIKVFCIADFNFGSIIRQICCYHGLHSPFESLIDIFSCH